MEKEKDFKNKVHYFNMDKLTLIETKAGKAVSAGISIAIGIAAATGAGFFGGEDQVKDINQNLQTQDSPKEVSNQIDENAEKLNALSDSSQTEKTDYRLLGC